MKAMIFAAGEGRRMRPLTLATPKPLLRVGQQSLLEHLIQKLYLSGVNELVINTSYLAEQVLKALENMDLRGLPCYVSVEEYPLETGGGLKRALPYLGDEPFLLVNSDVWSDIDFASLICRHVPKSILAHLVLVRSPDHNQQGDFVIEAESLLRRKRDGDQASGCLTFSGVSLISPDLVKRYADDRDAFPLRDLLFPAIVDGAVSGEYFSGYWSDVGTPERLEAVRRRYESI